MGPRFGSGAISVLDRNFGIALDWVNFLQMFLHQRIDRKKHAKKGSNHSARRRLYAFPVLR